MAEQTKLCECGCGQSVKNRFIRGHNTRTNNPMNLLETRHKIGDHFRGKSLSEEHRYKLREAHKGKRLSLEHRRKIGESSRGRIPSLETRRKIGEGRKGKKHSLETCHKIGEAHKGKKHSIETLDKMSKTRKSLWQDPDFRAKNLPILSRNAIITRRPTGGEIILGSILAGLNYPYHYTGNGKAIIDRMCPDFWWEEEQRVIEFYGSYWHVPEDELKRIDSFAKVGIMCLVVWDYELNDMEVLKNKIQIWHEEIENDR